MGTAQTTKHRRLRITAGLFAALLLLAVIACGIYVSDYYRADAAAVAAMASDPAVTVYETEQDIVIFQPQAATTGFIFYPGGKVEHTAYAPLLRALAEKGVFCVLVKMPFNLAVLDMNAAEGIPQQYPEITDWYIGGHSLGGSMAASHAAKHSDVYQGLVLLASYSTADLSGTDLQVCSIYGSADEVLNMENYQTYRSNLPACTAETVIEGGCHAWFGSYGPQAGDGTPGITAGEQIQRTIEAIWASWARSNETAA